MSSETITQNDLREILSRTVGSVPSEYKKLLWTNSSPTSSFGAQTISVDLSGYDEVCIEWVQYTSDTAQILSDRCLIGKTAQLFVTRVDTFLTQMRKCNATTSGVTFDECKLGSNATVYNNHCVPLHIYGIKYERVAPPQLETPIIQTLTVTAQTDANGYFHLPTSLNDVIPIWAEVSGRPSGLRPCFLTNGYTETERYGLRFKAWNDVVAYTSTTITVTIYYIKLVN